MVRWGIWLSIVPKASRDLNSLLCHNHYQQNNLGQQFSAGGLQWQPGGQPQQIDMVTSSAGSSRQHIQSGQGRSSQGRDIHASRGRGGRQQAQGRIHNISLQDAQNNLDLIMGETYTKDERN
ncbi:hypothetical protein C1H46_016399 [Malus baccata]|uniref:Uncharacterized protein n=1 Tax=Malus baccata TaxID=106549 RepID=A0A540MGM2_MALBA|nr:hypothetical protein C1H46_016399 [Malus baccata]